MNISFKIDKMSRDNDLANMQLDNMQVHLMPITMDAKLAYFKAKLVEESQEVLEATNAQEMSEELADCLEVIEGLVKAFNLDMNEIMQIKAQKREKRGGFEKGMVIDYITLSADHPRIDRFKLRPDKYPVIKLKNIA